MLSLVVDYQAGTVGHKMKHGLAKGTVDIADHRRWRFTTRWSVWKGIAAETKGKWPDHERTFRHQAGYCSVHANEHGQGQLYNHLQLSRGTMYVYTATRMQPCANWMPGKALPQAANCMKNS